MIPIPDCVTLHMIRNSRNLADILSFSLGEQLLSRLANEMLALSLGSDQQRAGGGGGVAHVLWQQTNTQQWILSLNQST